MRNTKNAENRQVFFNQEIERYLLSIPSKTGLLFKVRDIKTSFKTVLKKANIQDFRFHDLRHTAASYLAMNGASLLEISDMLGHKTMHMVQRYTHLMPEKRNKQ